MLVQDFLRSGGTLTSLKELYSIDSKRHGRYENLVLLKYNQIESPMANKMVQECRGVILDESDNWNVAARGFDKFFNHGEGHAAEIDWGTANIQEKLDGSLMMLYYYDSAWHVATTGSPDASGDVGDSGFTFDKMFWKSWKELGFYKPDDSTDCAFLFELTSPWNRVVVQHRETKLTLIGVRRKDGQELLPSYWSSLYPIARTYPLQNINQVMEAAKNLDPIQQEGFVVVDGLFRRVKVKSPQYVALHHMRDGFSQRRMVELVRSNDGSEFLQYFPEFTELHQQTKTAYDILVQHLENTYGEIATIPVQKDFAMEALKCRLPGALFSLRKGQVKSIPEFLSKIHIDNLTTLLSKKEAV